MNKTSLLSAIKKNGLWIAPFGKELLVERLKNFGQSTHSYLCFNPYSNKVVILLCFKTPNRLKNKNPKGSFVCDYLSTYETRRRFIIDVYKLLRDSGLIRTSTDVRFGLYFEYIPIEKRDELELFCEANDVLLIQNSNSEAITHSGLQLYSS